MKPPEDRRIQKTKANLQRSLLCLMQEKPLSEITVTDLCKNARINRNTFYAHYKNLKELLTEMQEHLLRQYCASMDRAFEAEDGDMMIIGVCETVGCNRDLCLHILSGRDGGDFVDLSMNLARQKFVDRWCGMGLEPSTADSVYTYIAGGGLSILRRWLEGGLRGSPSEVAALIVRMSDGVLSALTQNQDSPSDAIADRPVKLFEALSRA